MVYSSRIFTVMASVAYLHSMLTTKKMDPRISTRQLCIYPTITLFVSPRTTPSISTLLGQWILIEEMHLQSWSIVLGMEFPSSSGWYVCLWLVCVCLIFLTIAFLWFNFDAVYTGQLRYYRYVFNTVCKSLTITELHNWLYF